MNTSQSKTLLQRLREESSLTLRALVYALAALLLTTQTVQAAETVTYYHYDALGSPVAATDASGNLVWREDYKPYGERIRKPNALKDTTNGYTGHPEETALGLQYFGARWYDPTLGRFTGIDPKGFDEGNIQSFNRYAYANNNPYMYVDPDGKFAQIEILVFGSLLMLGALQTIAILNQNSQNAASHSSGNDGGSSSLRSNDNSGNTIGTPPPNDEDPITKRTGPNGVVQTRHNANVMVKDSNGNVVTHERIVSGNMTPTEKALGFPKNTLASHTEARAVTNTQLKSGDTMTITGQRPPCPSCKGYMNRASSESGATIRYQWRENGSTQRWTAGEN